MSNINKKSTQDMSRRRLLQLIGKAGIGAAVASPLAGAASQLGKWRLPPQPITHHQIPPTLGDGNGQGDTVFDDQFGSQLSDFGDLWLPGAVGVYGDGFTVVYSQNPDPNAEFLYSVRSYDVRAGQVPYNNNYWGTAQLGDLHLTNGIMVAPSADGGLACFPAKAVALAHSPGGVNAPNALSNLVDIGGALAYVAMDGNVYAYSFSVDQNGNIQGTQNWQCPLNIGFGSSGVVTYGGGNYLVASDGEHVALLDMATTPPTVQQATGLSDTALAIGISGSSYFPVIQAGGGANVYSYSLAAGTSQWATPYHMASTPGTPMPYGAYVLVADTGGNFTAIDALTGQYAWGVNLGGDCSQGPITVEDGIAYLCNADGIIFAVPLPPPNTQLPYSPGVVRQGQSGASGFLMGVENGVCFYGYIDGSSLPHIAAYDMAGQVHGFSCESTLLPDGMTGSPGSSQPESPVYHTYIQLLDPNKAPRAYISVNVSVYEAVTLSDGTTDAQGNPILYSLDPAGNPSVWLTTDSNGALNLTVQAVDLTCPSLYLWASFMDRDESMVIYPDGGSTQKLQGYGGSDYSAAKCYDGSQMITGSGVDTSGLATSVQAAIGSGGLSATSLGVMKSQQKQRGLSYCTAKRKDQKHKGRKRVLAAAQVGNTDAYVSFPGSTTNMLYQYPAGQENTRAYTANSADVGKSFTMDFTNGFVYSSGVSATAVHPQLLGSISFSDFKKAFVHGINVLHKIESTVSNDLKSIAHTIYSDLGDAFTLVVNTVEDAVTVIAAALKKVIGDIGKAIQWLSELFDWKNILANKDYLKGVVCGALTDFQTRLQGQTANACADIHGFFASVKKDFAGTFLPNANNAVGSSTAKGSQQNNNDPKSVFTNNSLGPANHFHSKLKNNIGKSQMDQSQTLRAFKVGGALDSSCATQSIASLQAQVEGMLTNAKNSLVQDAEQVKTDLENFLKSFLLLFNDPSAFLNVAFQDILKLLVALIDTLFDAADLVVEGVIAIASALIQGLMSLGTATIHIPLVSSLWSAITEDPLSLLDVACLLAAIPYTIMKDLESASQSVGGEITPLDKAWAIFVFFSAPFDAACDGAAANDPNSPLSILDMVLDSIAFGLSYPAGENLTALGGAYWVLQCTPILINVINCVLFATDSEEAEAFNENVPYLLNAFATIDGPGAVMMAFQEPNVYMGKDGLALIANLLGCFVNVAKPGLKQGPQMKAAVCVNDVASPWTGAIISLANDAAG